MNDINLLYQSILGRPVDSYGYLHYQKLIKESKWTIHNVKNDLINSKEKRRNDIKALYPKHLYREADEIGLNFYLNSNLSIYDIENQLKNSDERNLSINEYSEYYKHFPIKLSDKQYQESMLFLKTLDNYFLKTFNRNIDNINKFFYHLMYFKNKDYINNDLLSYKARVDAGISKMAKSKVVICGCLRDKEQIIDSLKLQCYEITKMFEDYVILIVENDSCDETRKRLLEWNKIDNKVIILGNGVNAEKSILNLKKTPACKPAGSDRIQKMAYIRNIYLDFVKEFYSHFDFTIVYDMDLCGDLHIDGICDTFSYMNNKNVDGITCNGMEKYHYHYYDSFAYVEVGQPFIWNSEDEKCSHDHYIFESKTKLHTTTMRVVKVLSAFGGFCVYRTSSITKYKYDYSPDKLSCEHSHLNSKFNFMYLNPRMVFLITDNS